MTNAETPDPCYLCGQPADYPGVWSFLRTMKPMPLCRECFEKLPTWEEDETELEDIA